MLFVMKPPTCTPILTYMSAEISSQGIKLSQFFQVLLHFYLFGPPMALGQGMQVPHMHAHIYMLKYTCKDIANGC